METLKGLKKDIRRLLRKSKRIRQWAKPYIVDVRPRAKLGELEYDEIDDTEFYSAKAINFLIWQKHYGNKDFNIIEETKGDTE